MSDHRDPVRLRAAHSGADPALRQLLEGASAALPSPARKNALDEAILRKIAEQADTGGSATGQRKLWFGRRTSLSLLVIVGLAATAGIGIASKSQRPEPASRPRASSSTATATQPGAAFSDPGSAPTAPQLSVAATTPQPGSAPGAPQSGFAPPPQQRSTVDNEPLDTPFSQRSAAISRATTAAMSGTPKAASAAERMKTAQAGAREATPSARGTAEQKRHSAARETAEADTAAFARRQADEPIGAAQAQGNKSAAPAQTNVPPELELLARAQRALRTAPAHAIQLTELHARAYPTGAFAEERDAIHVEALIAVHQVSLAQERGQAFLTRYKSSAYATRVRRLLEQTP